MVGASSRARLGAHGWEAVATSFMYSDSREKRHFFRVVNSAYKPPHPASSHFRKLRDAARPIGFRGIYVFAGHGSVICANHGASPRAGAFSRVNHALLSRISISWSVFRVHNSKKVAFLARFAVRKVHNSIFMAPSNPQLATRGSESGPRAKTEPGIRPGVQRQR